MANAPLAEPMDETPDAPVDPALRGEVASLTAQLVKSINQRGYYDPDHPAAQDIADGPFEQLQAWKGRVREIVFGRWGGQENDQLAVEGVFHKAIALADIVGQSSPYLEKLSDYFGRNRIISLSLKPGIPRDEYQRFLHVFVQHSQGPGGGDDGRVLAQAFEAQDILHVSLLVWADLVGGRELAWPVRIVLSRLCKDIRILPLYARANNQEIVEAKRLLVGDLVRPLRRADLVKELLMHCHVVEERVAQWSRDDAEDAVVGCLSPKMLSQTCWAFLGDMAGHEDALDPSSTPARVLGRLAPRLAQADDEETFDLFRRLLELGIVAVSHLPQALQVQLRTESWTDDFEQDADGFLTDLQRPPSPDRFEELLRISLAIFPELLARAHPEGARRIMEAVGSHAREAGQDAGHKSVIADAITHLRDPEHVELCMQLLEQAKPNQREHVCAILGRMGAKATERVLETLERHEQQRVRMDCCTILGAQGESAADKILSAMGQTGTPWTLHRDLCSVLGSLGTDRATPALVRAARHDHPNVRLEALDALAASKAKASTAAFVHALEDEDEQVQRRAVRLLVAARCAHPRLLGTLCDWLELKTSKRDEAPVALQLTAVRALRELGNVPMEDYGRAENLLADTLLPAPRFALLGKLTGSHVAKDESVQVASCGALAKMGTGEVLEALGDALDDGNQPVQDAAAKAIEEVEARS